MNLGHTLEALMESRRTWTDAFCSAVAPAPLTFMRVWITAFATGVSISRPSSLARPDLEENKIVCPYGVRRERKGVEWETTGGKRRKTKGG